MAENTHVVLVEDDPFLSDLASSRIQSAGFKLTHFAAADDALEKLEEVKPDIILLDLILPGMGGFEFLEAVKKDEKFKNIPVVIISNLGSKEEIEKGMQLGATSYLVKSNTMPDDIINKVKEVVGQ